jgi:hypothetical protein
MLGAPEIFVMVLDFINNKSPQLTPLQNSTGSSNPGAQFGQTSPPFYPSPWMDSQAIGWEDAYVKAKDFVSQMTLLEKVNLTTGVGWEGEQCVGQVNLPIELERYIY